MDQTYPLDGVAPPQNLLPSLQLRAVRERMACAPLVHLSVAGYRLVLPEFVLSGAAADLQTASGGYVAQEDYTASVERVLQALRRYGQISFPADGLRDQP